MAENTPSEFYFACRNKDMDAVHRLLNEHSLEELDQMEPNGSTALHAACYFQNIEIVQLLLERGFTRRAVNKYNNTPIDEGKTDKIRELFKRPRTSTRFGGNISYERERLLWTVIEGNGQHIVQYNVSDTYDGKRLEYGLFHSDRILQQLGNNMPKIDVVRRLFHRAINEKDCTRLIQAYTAETDFYNRVNDYLVSQNQQTIGEDSATNVISEFVDTIHLNRQLHDDYQYEGICYRSIKIKSHNELNLYKVGAKLLNRCFISTTKDRQLAEQYIRDHDEGGQNTVIISFEIRQNKTALDIEYLSEFASEKEVLIMNNSVFKVIRVTTKPNLDVEIELRESKSTRVNKKKIK